MTAGIRSGTATPAIGRSAPTVAALLQRTFTIQRLRPGGRRSAPSSSTVVWAVRRDWPVDGTHEFVCARPTERGAMSQLAKDRAFWRRGPIRPDYSVVRLSAHEFALHGHARRTCRAPDCATAAAGSATRHGGFRI